MLLTKLSAFYFFYFALLGVMAPYLGLFLESEGFSAKDIGLLTGLLMATKVLAPNVWSAIAHRHQKGMLLVRLGTLATLLAYFGFFVADSFWQYAAMIFLFSFFWNAVLPQFEVVTLHNLQPNAERYSLIRLWGSVGFIIAVVTLGWWFESFGVQQFPFALLLIIALIFLTSLWRFSEPKLSTVNSVEQKGLYVELKTGGAYLFFVICFLLQLSHGAYYSYFSLYLEQLGYGKFAIGWLWALGVIAEVVLFLVMHRWHARHSVRIIMAVALILSCFRWVLIAQFSDNLALLLFAQLLHAFSFGAMHAASIYFVHHHFSVQNQGRAQALYASCGFGLGGFVGAVLMAHLVQSWGYANLFWLSAALVSLTLFPLLALRSPKPSKVSLACNEPPI